MAFPDNVDTVEVSWDETFIAPDGSISDGYIDFTPVPSRIKAGDSIVQGTVTREFGVGSVELIATDSGNADPSNFQYRVTMRPERGPHYTFTAQMPKSGAEVNLKDLLPAGPNVLPSFTTLVDPSTLSGSYKKLGFTVTEFLAQSKPWYIGHRGSGAELAPEHTLQGYRSAISAGANAIEVSVHLSADNVLFCMHDDTFDRTTNKTGNALTWTYPAIRNLVRNKAKPLLGAGWTEDMCPPLLSEVLDEFAGKVVIFLEAKSNESVAPTQKILTDVYPDASQYVVWKNYYQATSFAWAKANGFTTWGYLDAATTDIQMNTYEPNGIDIWGLPKAMTDQRMIDVLNRTGGKPGICWEVHRRNEITRLESLTGTGTKKAVDGLMCANFSYLRRATALHTSDDWATQIKAPGDLPNGDYDATYALTFDTNGECYCPALSGASNGLHSFAPIVPGVNGYKIQFKMRFPVLPGTAVHGGVFFGKVSDDQYTFSSVNNKTGGYHMLLRGNGDFQLYTHTAGVTTGTQLATVNAGTILANTVYSFEVEVNATQVIARALDTPTVRTLTVSDTTYRGKYWGIHNGSLTDPTTIPRFRTGVIVQT